jgi:hypothetical protein
MCFSWHLDDMTSSDRQKRILLGVALCVVPTLVAALLLVVGVFTSTGLTLIYASIAVGAVALPAFVYGVVLIVRAVATGTKDRVLR